MRDQNPAPSPLTAEAAWPLCAEAVWLPTAEEMARLDRRAVGSGATDERTLIEVAGRELARLVGRRWPRGRVVALVGSGHNGADALVALRTLAAWGREVTAVRGGSGPPQPEVRSGWPIELSPPEGLEAAAAGAVVVLDGLLGTGLSGPPRETQARLIGRLNALRLPVVAVDGPSGADFTTGAVPGACVRADLTVCLGWPKLGLLRQPARGFCGELLGVEVGFPPPEPPPGARAITARWVRRMLRPRPPGAHKGDAGYVAVLAGQPGMAGAAVLAARAALRGGAGIVRVVSDEANRIVLQTAVPGATFARWEGEELEEAVAWSHALVVGPGLGRGPERRRLVERVLERRGERPALLDADALSVFAGELETLAARLRPGDLLTPHPGELARLTGGEPEEVLADPPGAARRAAEASGCVVLLKGAPSMVAAPGEALRVATWSGAALAAGGTGDVLAGLAGALLAAGMPAADAAAAGLLLSGIAAARSSAPVGHLAADLSDRLPHVRREVESLRPERPGPVLFAAAAERDPLR